MSKLWLIGLAASAAWTPAAIAQVAPPPPMAHGAHAPPPPMQPGMHPPMAMPGGRMKGMHHGMPSPGGQMKGMHHGMPRPGGHMNGMNGMHPGMPMPGGHMGGMKGFQHFGRGHFVPPHFRGRQFFVDNWQSFGFPAPMRGGHWIRYYDDALLIDGDGRVMDGRYGWDWDGRGGGMAYDDGGYDEDYDRYGDDYAGGGDYDRDEDFGREEEYANRDEDCGRSCGPARHLPPPPPNPGYGYGYGQGYGYGYGGYGAGCGCGPVVVTETITTTAPVMETRTYYETVQGRRAAPRRHYSKPVVRHYSKPMVRRSVKSAPAPRPGERG